MANKFEGPYYNEAYARMKADEIRFSRGAVVTHTQVEDQRVPTRRRNNGTFCQPGFYVSVKKPGETGR